MAILSPLLLWVALLLAGLCGVWMMVLGFKRHWAWGVGMVLPQVGQLLFLFAYLRETGPLQPVFSVLNLVGALVYLCFLVVGWPETKQPFFWWLSSILLFVLFMATLFEAGGPTPHIARVLRAQGVSEVEFERIGNLRSLRFGSRRSGSGQPAAGRPSWRSGSEERMYKPTPPPVFQSRLPAPRVQPGQREQPQAGVYYLLQRVSTKTSKGIQNGLPGEKVILLERLPGEKMKVTVGNADFIVHKSQVTDDVAVARDLEKQEFVARGGQL